MSSVGLLDGGVVGVWGDSQGVIELGLTHRLHAEEEAERQGGAN